MVSTFDHIDRTAISHHAAARRGTLRVRCRAFSLLETLVGIIVSAVMGLALFGGASLAVSRVRTARVEQLAAQVIVEKLETIRLYSWDKLTELGYIPTTFQKPIYPAPEISEQENLDAPAIFLGTIDITDSGMTETYAANVRKITVSLTWESDGLLRSNKMSTFVARYGIHTIIY